MTNPQEEMSRHLTGPARGGVPRQGAIPQQGKASLAAMHSHNPLERNNPNQQLNNPMNTLSFGGQDVQVYGVPYGDGRVVLPVQNPAITPNAQQRVIPGRGLNAPGALSPDAGPIGDLPTGNLPLGQLGMSTRMIGGMGRNEPRRQK